jgi:formate/nitrite transporter
MAWASGKVTTRRLLRNWGIVYLGNAVGALATAAVMFLTGQHGFGGGVVGRTALGIAHAKVDLGFVQAFSLGMMCNALVCLAVWLTYSARSTSDRILCVLFPITAFVAAGFEHCVANMYFVPVALFIKTGADASFWSQIGGSAEAFPLLTWGRFLLGNLLPVTLGNVVGGSLMVGATYWFVYLRGARA